MTEQSKALRTLPWYLLGSYLMVPAVFALFTAGASLVLYAAPFLALQHPDTWLVGLLPFIPGAILWAIRQFIRAAWLTYWRNRAY